MAGQTWTLAWMFKVTPQEVKQGLRRDCEWTGHKIAVLPQKVASSPRAALGLNTQKAWPSRTSTKMAPVFAILTSTLERPSSCS